MQNIAIVGAGFSGAVIARELAESGFRIDIFDSRNHLAGNCHTERDPETNIMIHTYGPHIFHTNNLTVWQYINRYGKIMPYTNRVKAKAKNSIYSMPVNLHTLNQYFGKTLTPKEAENFLAKITTKFSGEPQNFEEQAMSLVGRDLYETFFKGYTQKQWGRDPTQLPASILKRLPLRFNYDDNYFNHQYQGIPENGYTEIVNNILDHKNISIFLNTYYEKNLNKNYQHIFYSGPIDNYFEKCFGPLSYRTLTFQRLSDIGDYQGCAVLNYCDADIPYTRISEHKHFSPWESHQKTVCFKEFSSEATENDIPFYPIGLAAENKLLEQYRALAKTEKKVTFVGRLGTYRYLDMDVTIAEALDSVKYFKQSI
jgi:UDP-galactopyranose mutase